MLKNFFVIKLESSINCTIDRIVHGFLNIVIVNEGAVAFLVQLILAIAGYTVILVLYNFCDWN